MIIDLLCITLVFIYCPKICSKSSTKYPNIILDELSLNYSEPTQKPQYKREKNAYNKFFFMKQYI